MAHFLGLDDVQEYVLQNGRAHLEELLRSGRIEGEANMLAAHAWLQRDDALNAQRIVKLDELRRAVELDYARRSTEAAEALARAARNAQRLSAWALGIALGAAFLALASLVVFIAMR